MNDNEHDARDSVEQAAIERVAGVLDDALGDLYVDGDVLDMNDIYNITAAAIAAYNAYLRERAQEPDVVEAGARAIHSTEHLLSGEWGPLTEREELEKRVISSDAKEGYRYTATIAITAALDAMLGKETHDAD